MGAEKASGKARRSELAMRLLEGRARPIERTGCKGPEVKSKAGLGSLCEISYYGAERRRWWIVERSDDLSWMRLSFSLLYLFSLKFFQIFKRIEISSMVSFA